MDGSSRAPLVLASTLVSTLVGLGASIASASPIHDLPTTEYTFELPAHNATIKAFRVIAPTPVLTAKLNSLVAWTAGIEGVAQSTQSREISCEATITTDVFASWVCSGIVYSGDGGGTARVSTAATVFVEGDRIRHAKVEDLFGPDAKKRIAALSGTRSDSPCTPDPSLDLFVTSEGVTFTENERDCTVGWDVMLPLLVKGSVVRRIVDPAGEGVLPAPDNPKAAWAKAQPRFVRQDGGVVDRASGLMWAERDNGADIDHAGAVAYAAAYAAGPYDDWRLPTEDELESLSDPADAHRDKKDCTRGKNALLVTSQIQLSCGLAWSSSTPYTSKNPIAFGFISGTPRVAKPKDKKNYRALVVRDTTPPAKH